MKDVIVILGPTAVGKSDLAVACALKLNGEIISADSMQIYRELNIGTAKITEKEMQHIPHHLLNNKSMNESYNVWQFVNDCKQKIDEIIDRGNTPIVVGGTNLYITALIKNYDFDGENAKDEKKYESKHDVQYKLFAVNFDSREELYKRINNRVDIMLENGFLEEVKQLKNADLTTESQAGKSIGYKELLEFLDGKTDFETAVDKIKQHSRNFAKRQLTWLRSMRDLVWLNANENAKNLKIILGS